MILQSQEKKGQTHWGVISSLSAPYPSQLPVVIPTVLRYLLYARRFSVTVPGCHVEIHRQDNDANKNLYGKEVKAKDMVFNGAVAAPPSAYLLLATLNKKTPKNKSKD